MNQNSKHFVIGFLKQAEKRGLPQNEAIALVKQAGFGDILKGLMPDISGAAARYGAPARKLNSLTRAKDRFMQMPHQAPAAPQAAAHTNPDALNSGAFDQLDQLLPPSSRMSPQDILSQRLQGHDLEQMQQQMPFGSGAANAAHRTFGKHLNWMVPGAAAAGIGAGGYAMASGGGDPHEKQSGIKAASRWAKLLARRPDLAKKWGKDGTPKPKADKFQMPKLF